jgi:uncharacterized protein
MTAPEFLRIALANPANDALLARLRGLCLPQCHLTAGCLFQTVWNATSGRIPGWGVKDYDVFYFDDCDLSFEAEDAIGRRVREATADLGIEIEVKNQARVHLWYPEHFKQEYPPLHSAREGIDRFLVACTCVGIEAESTQLYAPDGHRDLASGALRINPRWPCPELFPAKARSYQARWPWLQVLG